MLRGAIIGGFAGLIIGIVVFMLIGNGGESFAIVDPGAPAAAMLMVAVTTVVGLLIGGLIAYLRR